jgi:redox-sensitive bicupin YhaK (pirin superfamily)
MFKWQADPVQDSGGRHVLGTSIYRDVDDGRAPSSTGVDMRRVFEGPTMFLGKLHAHVTTLQPGAGYAPHVDGYDVAILTLAGTVETVGQRVDPLSVIYYGAGEPHGMCNVGAAVARYLVFEFHGAGTDPFARSSPFRRHAAGAVRMGKRVAGAAWRRVRGG